MTEQLELRHLRYFIAVAEELHFGRAAKRLNMAQPPLSQQIRQLEATLGVRLLDRTSRRVELTPAGAALLGGARRTLAEAAHSAEIARRAARGELDTLRIGFTDSAALSVLPTIVRRYRARHPEIHLELGEASTLEQLDAVERDLVDVALVRGPVSAPALRTEVIYQEAFVVALPNDHALVVRGRLSLKSLGTEPIVLFPRHLAPIFHDQIVEMCRDAGFVPDVRVEAADYQTMLSLVAAGLGVSLVPASVSNLARAGVTYRGLMGAKRRAQVAMVYQDRRMMRALSAFIVTAREAGAATVRE
jgi:DNA-binding transcriptional LysR family regulator